MSGKNSAALDALRRRLAQTGPQLAAGRDHEIQELRARLAELENDQDAASAGSVWFDQITGRAPKGEE